MTFFSRVPLFKAVIDTPSGMAEGKPAAACEHSGWHGRLGIHVNTVASACNGHHLSEGSHRCAAKGLPQHATLLPVPPHSNSLVTPAAIRTEASLTYIASREGAEGAGLGRLPATWDKVAPLLISMLHRFLRFTRELGACRYLHSGNKPSKSRKLLHAKVLT